MTDTQDRQPCAAKGCGRWSQGFSRYCTTHRYRMHYTRSETGRILRRGRDLGEFRKLADPYLMQHKDHPAIVKACAWLESPLTDASAHTGSSSVHRDMAKELRRLRLDGATGLAMLQRVTAVAAYAHWHRRTFDDGPCFTVNLGHHLLRTTARPGSGKVKGKVAFELGREVRETLGLLLSQVATAIEADVTKQARARDAIKDALRLEPLA